MRFNYSRDGEHFRFSLERRIKKIVRGADGKWLRDRETLGDKIESKGDAQREATAGRRSLR